MYYCEYNQARALGVWVFRGSGITPQEWSAHVDDIRTLTSWHGKNSLRPAVLLLVLGGTDRPDALRRQELAALTAAPGYNPHLAVVSSNPLIRGALMALRWLQKTPNYEADTFADTTQALGWLEKRRGEALPELALMMARGRGEEIIKKAH
jgi:hypothetical protein